MQNCKARNVVSPYVLQIQYSINYLRPSTKLFYLLFWNNFMEIALLLFDMLRAMKRIWHKILWAIPLPFPSVCHLIYYLCASNLYKWKVTSAYICCMISSLCKVNSEQASSNIALSFCIVFKTLAIGCSFWKKFSLVLINCNHSLISESDHEYDSWFFTWEKRQTDS